MRQSALLLALVEAAPAAAWLGVPFVKSSALQSWSPARETSPVDDWTQGQVALGVSPKPTAAPKPIFGRMLVPRLDEFELGAETCGYISSNGQSFTCISSQATCTSDGAHLGCCESNKDCNIIKTTCIGFEDVEAGKCNLPDDFHTLCCPDSALPSCFTYIMESTASSGAKPSMFSLLDCATREGTAVLLDYDPAWSKTHSFGAKTSSSERETSTNGSSSDDDEDGQKDSGGGKKSNTGAIVGGVVGGVVVLAIIGVLIFFCIRRQKNKKAATASPATTSAHMSQYGPVPNGPGGPYDPSSPGGSAMYPSGVPQGYQGYPPQPWNPQTNTLVEPQQQGYGQHPQAYPTTQGYNGLGYNPAHNQQTSPVSSPSPPGFGPSPSPGAGGVTPVSPGANDYVGSNRPVSELPIVHPVGSVNNRAEMG